MARKLRSCPPGKFFHLCNRSAGHLTLFQNHADYLQVLRVLREAMEKFPVAIFAYSIMPNHWHLLAQARRPLAISQFLHWFGTTHAKRWRGSRESLGRGAVYQNRFRSHGVEGPIAFIRTAAYIERNALAAGLVPKASDWPWCSAGSRRDLILQAWPYPKPTRWRDHLAQPLQGETLRNIRYALRSSLTFEVHDPSPPGGLVKKAYGLPASAETGLADSSASSDPEVFLNR